QLVAVALDQPGVTVTTDGWQAVGMAATGSVEVVFEGAEAQAIGNPGDYLQRPGFWQGGIGIAACWYGAAQSIAERLRRHCAQRPEPHALAHLGAVDSALHAAAEVLRVSALAIDAQPTANAELLARRARAVVENSAEQVIQHVGRALGAGPYCKDRQFAQLIADLPVFLRQSHAERDLAALGQAVINEDWTL
ncbi:acyl-CoA dehydrogenase, partial [Pseudomonas prosekii]